MLVYQRASSAQTSLRSSDSLKVSTAGHWHAVRSRTRSCRSWSSPLRASTASESASDGFLWGRWISWCFIYFRDLVVVTSSWSLWFMLIPGYFLFFCWYLLFHWIPVDPQTFQACLNLSRRCSVRLGWNTVVPTNGPRVHVFFQALPSPSFVSRT